MLGIALGLALRLSLPLSGLFLLEWEKVFEVVFLSCYTYHFCKAGKTSRGGSGALPPPTVHIQGGANRGGAGTPLFDLPVCLTIHSRPQILGPEAAGGLWGQRPAQPSSQFLQVPSSRVHRVWGQWKVAPHWVPTSSRPLPCTTLGPSPSSPTRWPLS